MAEDENNFCRYGTPLEPLDEDEIPSKKPIAIEDQIVTDSNGKRRFHGAFTGGFSAGFWNTVGSLEGWKPQSFKSSRAEKAKKTNQRPTDFMDEEDLGEFGIAPQRIQTTEEFTRHDASTSLESSRKRKLQQISGPIPGIPVLKQLLAPAKENVAIRLLKKMGWKEGQGIGARQTRREKKSAAKTNARERYVMKMYGCDMHEKSTREEKESASDHEDGDSDLSDDEITFAPDDFEPFVCNIKGNTFGLGYQGLSRDPVLQKQHINLFGTFEVMGKDNKKLSIRGQAFGVGALEEEDDDIYERDDMTRYDFSLGDAAQSKGKVAGKTTIEYGVLEGFQRAQNKTIYQKKIYAVTLPDGYKPRNWAVRKSRFEPMEEDRAILLQRNEEYKTKGLGRHDLDPKRRGEILGETSNAPRKLEPLEPVQTKNKSYLERINAKYKKTEKESSRVLDMIASKMDNFSKGEVLNATLTLEEATQKENEKVQTDAMKITKNLDKTAGIFKPFMTNDMKQDRYEKFLEKELWNDDEITKFLSTIQPFNMSEWDKEMEKKEFVQARNIYRPLKGLMSDRFVSEATVVAERLTIENVTDSVKKIVIVRTKSMWKPSAQLCKRFNVAEPFGGAMDEIKEKKKPRFSVFDYLETSINTKDNFVTPVIIPTKAEKPKPIVSQNRNEDKTSERLSTKEMVSNEISSSKIEWKRVMENKPAQLEPLPIKKPNDKNKTPLEKKIEELKSKHPSEKKDLFKAIFDSSSEDEAEPREEIPKHTDVAQIVGTEAHKDIFATMKQSAADINILRNTSPPRGIFASLFAKKPGSSIEEAENESKQPKSPKTPPQKARELEADLSMKISFKPRNERITASSIDIVDDTYGPKVPTTLSTTPKIPDTQGSEIDAVDDKLLKMLTKQRSEVKITEEWVERGDAMNNRKKKKRDKEKHKKKKTKKHKKEKRSSKEIDIKRQYEQYE